MDGFRRLLAVVLMFAISLFVLNNTNQTFIQFTHSPAQTRRLSATTKKSPRRTATQHVSTSLPRRTDSLAPEVDLLLDRAEDSHTGLINRFAKYGAEPTEHSYPTEQDDYLQYADQVINSEDMYNAYDGPYKDQFDPYDAVDDLAEGPAEDPDPQVSGDADEDEELNLLALNIGMHGKPMVSQDSSNEADLQRRDLLRPSQLLTSGGVTGSQMPPAIKKPHVASGMAVSEEEYSFCAV